MYYDYYYLLLELSKSCKKVGHSVYSYLLLLLLSLFLLLLVTCSWYHQTQTSNHEAERLSRQHEAVPVQIPFVPCNQHQTKQPSVCLFLFNNFLSLPQASVPQSQSIPIDTYNEQLKSRKRREMIMKSAKSSNFAGSFFFANKKTWNQSPRNDDGFHDWLQWVIFQP